MILSPSSDTSQLSPFDTAVLRIISDEIQQGGLPTKDDIIKGTSELAAQAMSSSLAKLEWSWFIRVREEEPNDSGSRIMLVYLISATGQRLLDLLDKESSAE